MSKLRVVPSNWRQAQAFLPDARGIAGAEIAPRTNTGMNMTRGSPRGNETIVKTKACAETKACAKTEACAKTKSPAEPGLDEYRFYSVQFFDRLIEADGLDELLEAISSIRSHLNHKPLQ